MKPLSPNFTVRPSGAAVAATSSICAVSPSRLVPLEKYQSDTRPAIARAAVEFPPWKMSGCGRPGTSTGFGLRENPRNR